MTRSDAPGAAVNRPQPVEARAAFAAIDAAFDRAMVDCARRPSVLSPAAISLIVDIIFVIKLARHEKFVIATFRAAIASIARNHEK